MTFDDLLPGDAVFLDANTFIYHFTPEPVLGPACTQLLQRIENQELLGFTSAAVLAEVDHKMMTVEANQMLGWPFRGMANRLRRHPAEVQRLTRYRACVAQVARSRIQVLALTLPVVEDGTLVSQQTGLLTNDALIISTMQAHGLSKLASHDADFDRVPGITRYAPA